MATRDRRQRERSDRRQEILAAARRLFWRLGYRGATMPRIARELDLAPGTLYLYFPGKDALYAELLLEGYDLLERRLRQAIRPEEPPQRQAEALIDTFLAFGQESPEYFDILFFLVQMEATQGLLGALDRDQPGRLEARQETLKSIALEVLERLQPPGSAELHRLVDAVWGMLVGLVLSFRRQGSEVMAAVASTAKGVILRGILGV